MSLIDSVELLGAEMPLAVQVAFQGLVGAVAGPPGGQAVLLLLLLLV